MRVVCVTVIVLGFFFSLPCIVAMIEMFVARTRLKKSGQEIEAGFYKQYEPREEDCSLMIVGVVAAFAALVYLILNTWGW